MSKGRHLLAPGLVLACFACASSGENAAANADPGFRRYEKLGDACRASVAVAPADAYRPLSFIPCTWGEARCKQLAWDGEVKWDPTGSGDDLLLFSLQAALDSNGALRRILVTHQYAVSSHSDGVPFEAVAYDTASGKPLAAWRNPGDAVEFRPGDPLASRRSCVINVAIGTDNALVLATPSASNSPVMARESFAPGTSSRGFEPIAADRSVMLRAPMASSKTAAFYEDSGKMWRVDLAGNAVASDHGPGQRLWPLMVAGNDVLSRPASPTTEGYYLFKGVGAYERIPVLAPVLVADAVRFGWATPTAYGQIEVRSAPRGALDPSTAARVVATITAPTSGSSPFGSQTINAATIGDGVMAIQTREPMRPPSTLYLVSLDTGAVRRRTLDGSRMMTLVANSATEAWLGYSRSAFVQGDGTQFDALVVLDMAETCAGTPVCSGLAPAACSAAPGCKQQPPTCTGTSTDPCTYTTEADCFAHACGWDSLKNLCSTRGGCADVPEEACKNTAGCKYVGACAPTISACHELGPEQCGAQPGCAPSR